MRGESFINKTLFGLIFSQRNSFNQRPKTIHHGAKLISIGDH